MSLPVRTTPRADTEIRHIDVWWAEHRPAAPDLFLDELADAFALLRVAPDLGQPYPSSRVLGSGAYSCARAATTSTFGPTKTAWSCWPSGVRFEDAAPAYERPA